MCLIVLIAVSAEGQVAFKNNYAMEHFANGMYAPTEMAFDPWGNLFIGSGYEPGWPVGGQPTPIFKVFPDGTCVAFSDPIGDPDALTVDGNGNVYVGSYGGKITHIDGITEHQSIWIVDSRLKNIDGLRFAPSGELFVVAIDSPKVHAIDASTKVITEFADLSPTGITGMSGIAFDPVTGHIFVESCYENLLVELDTDGTVLNPDMVQGFLFMGFIDFDPTGNHDGILFAPDAVLGQVYMIDVNTGDKTLLIDDINPGPVGLVFNENGDLYFNQNFDQVQQGNVFRSWSMEVDLPADVNLGDPFTVKFISKHDELVPFAAFLAVDDNGPYLPDGRQWPLSMSPFIMLMNSVLDGTGEAAMNLTIPVDQSLVGLTVYFAFVTFEATPFNLLALSEAAGMTIH